MARRSCTTKIRHRLGLHARPAALFVQLANTFHSDVTVRKGRQAVNGKSIMGILSLAAQEGARIRIEADGADAKEAISALVEFISKDSLNAH